MNDAAGSYLRISAAAGGAASNVPEYTVSEISGAVKRTLEGAFGRVRVRGEISGLKKYPSGHVYFDLKDEGGKISGVVWRGQVRGLGLVPENGTEVVATGKVSSYGERSSYQLVVERMEYAGEGALLARIERLRLRLAAEGLFDEARKRPLPVLPVLVGVVTSAQGAVLHDIRTTLLRRFPRALLVWPVPVQGEGAAERIAAAILGFDSLHLHGLPRPDVVIVARGGGSLEDLMAFNEEVVVRAVAACTIPLVSAVGHETDTTLIDFVSDRRAPTPTAAAEMVVPARAELLATVAQEGARLEAALGRRLRESTLHLEGLARGLPDPSGLVGTARQRVDDRAQRLEIALPNLLQARRAALGGAGVRLPDLPGLLRDGRRALGDRAIRLKVALPNLLQARRSSLVSKGCDLPKPRSLLAGPEARVLVAGSALRGALRDAVRRRAALSGGTLGRLNPAPVEAGLRAARLRLDGLAARLESVSHHAVLARGYALLRDGATGQPLQSAAAVRPGARVRIELHDGEVWATTTREPGGGQGALPL